MNKTNNDPIVTQGENSTFASVDSPLSVPQSTQDAKAPSDQAFTLVINGAQQLIDVQNLESQALIDLAEQCSAASGSVVIDVTNLPKFSQQDRSRVISFTAIIDRRTIVVGGDKFDDLLEAILSLLKPGLTTSHLTQVKVAALEVAALLFSQSLPEACQRIQEKLRDVGQKGIRQVDLIREAMRVQSQLEGLVSQSEAKNHTLVKEVFRDAPVPPSLRLPDMWSVAEGGLVKSYGKISGKLTSPVFVIAIIQDQTGKQAVMVCWCTLGAWHTKIVDRIDIADKARCTALASLGVPVTCNNATLLVQFLAEFIAENEQDLPLVKSVSKMGFHQNGEKTVFVLGHQVISSDAVVDPNHDSHGDSNPTPQIVFKGHDEGLDQLAEGYHSRGTFEAWYSLVVVLLQFPKQYFMLMTSFASVVLEITGTPNFSLSVAGRTTTGKTSALKICASAWGSPNDNADTGLVSNWDGTSTHRERYRLALNNLPVFLDETKLAKGSEQEVPKTLYAVSSGRSRQRGTLKGIARQESSRNVTFMSGEQAATSFAQDGGAFARVLELLGSPFGENSQHTGVLVRESIQGIRENYGHAGPRFVQFVLNHQADWPQWRERYRQLVTQYENRAGSNHILCRQASYLAAITLTSQLVHEALGLPGSWTDPVEPLWDELAEATQAADLPKRALLLAYEFAVKSINRFQLGGQNGRFNDFGKPPQDIIGRWEPKSQNTPGLTLPIGSLGDHDEPEWVGFIPNELEKLLNDHGFQLDAIVRQWSSSGWLVTDNEEATSRNKKKTLINGKQVRVIAISGAAIATALC